MTMSLCLVAKRSANISSRWHKELYTCFRSSELNFCRRNAFMSILPGGFPIPVTYKILKLNCVVQSSKSPDKKKITKKKGTVFWEERAVKMMAPNEPTYRQSRKVTTTIQMAHNTFQPVRQKISNYQYILYTQEKSIILSRDLDTWTWISYSNICNSITRAGN